MFTELPYCNSLTNYSKLKTREVKVGELGIGGDNPIRIQSMTITNTLDTEATIAEVIRLVEAGCELVRITAPSIKEAENLRNIKNGLIKQDFDVPLVADIHYTPNAALVAAQFVEKVRINPGNYTDRKHFKIAEYTDSAYQQEIDNIQKRIVPLIKTCKRHNTAMRIGVNHGSLSDRIMSRYGDTPLGMVESGLEFVRICERENFYNIILSMKSSNPLVMVQANRLLAAKMIERNSVYPIHLGVTEAGEGEDGRIKSSIGIGTILEDGIGDTIRVSLTENSENEIPVANTIVRRYSDRMDHSQIKEIDDIVIDPYQFSRRNSTRIGNLGSDNPPRIIIDLSRARELNHSDFQDIGYKLLNDKWYTSDQSADYVFVGDNKINSDIPGGLSVIQNLKTWKKRNNIYPLLTMEEYLTTDYELSDKQNFVVLRSNEYSENFLKKIKNDDSVIIILKTNNKHGAAEQRRFIFELLKRDINKTVIINREYKYQNSEELLIDSSIDVGSLLVDGLIDGLWIESVHSPQIINQISFGILQATRSRITKTEYISCPSCGRTQFDLQEVTAKIRRETEHLKGVKIGIMGCIVNGPGEMADADYGYVGTGTGTIALYKGQNVVQKNIPEKDAVKALINLIKEHGDWINP
jgi:(E)-4-hydroxy-3-methylbut-2-enyl-diphosphate synthase